MRGLGRSAYHVFEVKVCRIVFASKGDVPNIATLLYIAIVNQGLLQAHVAISECLESKFSMSGRCESRLISMSPCNCYSK